MLSIKKLCYYQIRGRSGMYGSAVGFMLVFIGYAVYMCWHWQNGLPVMTERGVRLLMGVLLPFFSCFMILPYADEVMHTDFEEITFLYRNKLDWLFVIQNAVYYILILILFLILHVVYDDIFSIWYQICFLCIYLQLFTFAGYFLTRSNFATCAVILFYFSVTLMFVMSNNQNVIYDESAGNMPIVLELPFGYFQAFGGDMVSFFKEQGWKMIVAALAVILSVVNRRQMFLTYAGRSASGKKEVD